MKTVRCIFIFRGFAALVACCAMTLAGAQTTADNARFLADLTVRAQFEQSIQATRKQMPTMMKQISAMAGDPSGSAELIKMMERMQPLQDRMMERMVEELAKPEIRSQLSDAVFTSINRIYDAAEIDSLAAYYRTPIGAAVVAKQGALMADLLPETTAITMKAMQPLMAEMMEGVKKLALEARGAKAK